MSADLAKILIVDDDRAVLEMLNELLRGSYRTILAASGQAAIEAASRNPDLAAVIMDIKMPGMSGIEAQREIKKLLPEIAIILHTGYPGDYDEDQIDEEEKPFDYVLKGDSIRRLLRTLKNAVVEHQLRQAAAGMPQSQDEFCGIIGRSARMQAVFRLIKKVAASSANAMILGETGTGKELVARAIHYTSARKAMKFGILNCNHKSPDLVESDLFGHLKGAFTGAIADRIGLFEYADQGTVFLDDVCDLDITTQAKLLRVIETGEFQKIGDSGPHYANVRIISSTRRDLEQMVKEGSFRADLYYRLKGIMIELPPLRERKEDIPLLVERFTDRLTIESGSPPKLFDPQAVSALIYYDWPGNIRQLLRTIEALIVLSDSETITGEEVHNFLKTENNNQANGTSLMQMQDNFLRACVTDALQQAAGNVASAATALGIHRTHMYKLIKRLKIPL